MTYPKTLTRYQELTIAPVLKKLESLAEGNTLTITVNAPQRLKYLLYAHWRIHNIKDLFKILQNGNTLTIIRLKPLKIYELQEEKLSEAEEYLLSNALLTIESQDLLEAHLEETTLEPKVKYSIIECWLQHQGI